MLYTYAQSFVGGFVVTVVGNVVVVPEIISCKSEKIFRNYFYSIKYIYLEFGL